MLQRKPPALTKDEIIIPPPHVNPLTPPSPLSPRSLHPLCNPLHPNLHILQNIPLHTPHRTLRKSLPHNPALPRMLHPLSGQQRTDRSRVRAKSVVKNFRFLHICSMAIDYFQSRRIVDGERVGGEADHKAVAGMEVVEVNVFVAAVGVVDVVQLC